MANSCSKLMKDAIDVAINEFKGIELNYKLDEVLGGLKPSMKFSAEQLKGYLLKQGVSPNEIKASKMFEGFENDNRALPISDWMNNSGSQKFNSRLANGYEDITLSNRGTDSDTNYRVKEFFTSEKANLPTNLRHNFQGKEVVDENKIAELNSRVSELNDLVQSLRADKSKLFDKLMENWEQPEVQKEYDRLNKEIKSYNSEIRSLNREIDRLGNVNNLTEEKSQLGWNRVHQDEINGKPTTVLNELQSDWMQAERQGAGTFESKSELKNLTKEEEELRLKLKDKINNIIKDYNRANPGKEVYVTDDLVEKDLIPIEEATRYKELDRQNQQVGNAKLIADFPMKPEKFQQLMIVDALNEAIENGTKRVAIPIERENELVGSAGVTKFYDSLNKKILPEIRKKLEKQGLRVKVSKEDYGTPFKWTDKVLNEDFPRFARDNDYASMDTINSKLSDWESENGLIKNKDDLIKFANDMDYDDLVYEFLSSRSGANKLHILEIEEVPNAKVKWDVYGLLASIGLGAYATQGQANEPISTTSGVVPKETNSMNETIKSEGKPNIFRLQKLTDINPEQSSTPKTNEILNYFAKKESGGSYTAKSEISSAFGKYQFIRSTLAEKAKKHGMTIKEARTPRGQETLIRKVLRDYKAKLRSDGLPVTKENLFIIHNLGEYGGIKAIKGEYTPKVIRGMRNNIKGKKSERMRKPEDQVIEEYFKLHPATRG